MKSCQIDNNTSDDHAHTINVSARFDTHIIIWAKSIIIDNFTKYSKYHFFRSSSETLLVNIQKCTNFFKNILLKIKNHCHTVIIYKDRNIAINI